MLTPNQLKNYDFQSVGRNAYKATDVDAYMSEVYDSYEQMFRENGELVKKIGLLADKLAEYKNDSDNIRNALLTAERMKDKIIQEAEEKAKETIEETEEKVRAAIEAVNEKTSGVMEKATENAEKIVCDAQNRADEIVKVAQENATKLLSKAQKLYDEQMITIKDEVEKENLSLNNLKKESTQLRESLIQIYTKQLDMVNYIPTFEEYETQNNKKTDGLHEADLKEDDGEEIVLSDFIDDAQKSNNDDCKQNLDESQIDEYISYEHEENKSEKSEIEESINEYISKDKEEDEHNYMEYAPLEYINDGDKGADYNDRDIRDDKNGQNHYTEYEEENKKENEEKIESENDEYDAGYDGDDSEEGIKDLRVNIEEFYSEEDEDVITLKNFFKENDYK